jgi:phosphoglycolate phosphatase
VSARPSLHWRGQPLRALLIDLDGTLVDTLGDFELALGRMLAELGHTAVSRAFIERTVGQGSEHLIRCTLAEAGAPATLFDAAWAAYQRHYLAINGQAAALYPGVSAGLAALRALGLPLVCLTNKPGAFAEGLLRAKDLRGHFLHVFGGDAFARKKPDPMPLLGACAALGTAPAQTLMVGDSRNDVQAARAAGCPVVLVPYGYNHGEPAEAAGADAIVSGIDALAVSLSSGP